MVEPCRHAHAGNHGISWFIDLVESVWFKSDYADHSVIRSCELVRKPATESLRVITLY